MSLQTFVIVLTLASFIDAYQSIWGEEITPRLRVNYLSQTSGKKTLITLDLPQENNYTDTSLYNKRLLKLKIRVKNDEKLKVLAFVWFLAAIFEYFRHFIT